MATLTNKLTGKQRVRLLGRIGERMTALDCGALDACLDLYRQAEAQNDQNERILIRKLVWRTGLGRLFDAMLKADKTQAPLPQRTQQLMPQFQQQAGTALAGMVQRFMDANSQAAQQLAQTLTRGQPQAGAGQPGQPGTPQPAQPAQAQPAPTPTQPSQPQPSAQEVREVIKTARQIKGDANVVAAHAIERGSIKDAAAALHEFYSTNGSSTGPMTPEHFLHPTPHRSIDTVPLAQCANRLKDALAARSLSRTIHETEAGRVDYSRLAQVGGGLTLRPYEDTTPGRSLDTAVYVMIDASGSMGNGGGGGAINPAVSAGLAIAQACKAARLPVMLGVFGSTPRTLWRGGALSEARNVLERLLTPGSTNTAIAVRFACAELLAMRAKRRAMILLCDGFLQAKSGVWAEAVQAGIDWRVIALAPGGSVEFDDKAPTQTPLWKKRLHVVKTGADAAHEMLDELRRLLEHGARENLRALALT